MAASNPKSRTDAFGVMAMPKDGWNSVDIFEEYEWETKDGIYIRFDNTQNPASNMAARIGASTPRWTSFSKRLNSMGRIVRL